MSKTKIITNDIVANTNTQRIIFKILIALLISLSIVYIYMIGSITFNVVARRSLENTEKQIGSNISQLELTYLTRMNEVDKARAISLGYMETNKNIFAVRTINYVAMR